MGSVETGGLAAEAGSCDAAKDAEAKRMKVRMRFGVAVRLVMDRIVLQPGAGGNRWGIMWRENDPHGVCS